MIRIEILFLIVICCCGSGFAETPPLLQRFTETGIAINDQQTCLLPKPSLQAGQDAAARKAILEDLAGGRGWKNFSRKSVMAPVAIDVKYIKDANGERIGHQAHSAFIVHAALESLKDEELMKQVFGEPEDVEDAEDFVVEELKEEELESSGIDPVGENESYGTIQMPLLKRVIIRGVVHTERLLGDDSVIIVWEIDPRFTSDDSGRNTWALINRDDLGNKQEGEQQPYQGAGGYMVVSRLTELPGACLVESHLVLHEPPEWFRGSNVLRSKLPILMQESARSFRRKLTEK